jgi:hypothetical protein
MFRGFCYYSGNSGWLSLKHVLNFILLGQLGVQCFELKQIIHGYINGTLIGLIGCVVISTTSLTLMRTTNITCFFLFLL